LATENPYTQARDQKLAFQDVYVLFDGDKYITEVDETTVIYKEKKHE